MSIRQSNWDNIENKVFDVTLMGAGINGTALYRTLTQQGYRVLLLDKGDFACGTSQASAMMIWGGLLYLAQMDLLAVLNFSRDRERMIQAFGEHIQPQHFRYVANKRWGRNKYLVHCAMQFYWLLGGFRRNRPVLQNQYAERGFLNPDNHNESILYQEGMLRHSDSRFVLDWILNWQTEDCQALNYCTVGRADYHKRSKRWVLELKDQISGQHRSVTSKVVINTAGVWTDQVNRQFNIKSPYKHVFSKGVFLGFQRPPEHRNPLIFEMGQHGDTLTCIPWGPVSLWGPTETMVTSIEAGYQIEEEDIAFLMKHARRNLDSDLPERGVVSMRCGLRPLVVEKSFTGDCYPLSLSRYHKIVSDPELPWISVYGGKISGCLTMAEQVKGQLLKRFPVSGNQPPENDAAEQSVPSWTFPGLDDEFPHPQWCAEHEFCCTLDDYLRRRTNIAQWVTREGLGDNDQHLEHLTELAGFLPKRYPGFHTGQIKLHQARVRQGFDTLLNGVNKGV